MVSCNYFYLIIVICLRTVIWFQVNNYNDNNNKKNTKLDMTGWERWSIGNCARNWNLTILWNRYMYKPESIPENEPHKTHWDFGIPKDHLIPGRRLDRVIINKKKICRPGESQSENQREWKEKHLLGPCLRTKNVVEHESDSNTNCNWCTWNGPQRFYKGTGRVGNQRTSWDHPNYSITKMTRMFYSRDTTIRIHIHAET